MGVGEPFKSNSINRTLIFPQDRFEAGFFRGESCGSVKVADLNGRQVVDDDGGKWFRHPECVPAFSKLPKAFHLYHHRDNGSAGVGGEVEDAGCEVIAWATRAIGCDDDVASFRKAALGLKQRCGTAP